MRPELAGFTSQLEVLIAFVEGRLDGPSLDAALGTDEMKTLLSSFEDPRYPAISNHLRRLQKQQGKSLGGYVNSEGIVEDFLRKGEVDFTAAKRYSSAYRLILGAIPKYVDPPLDYLLEHVLPKDESLSESKKSKIIKERIKEQFRFVSKPPAWVQSGDWPIRNGKPLVFIGQIPIDAPDLFHDSGAVFLFYDPVNGGFETVAQFY